MTSRGPLFLPSSLLRSTPFRSLEWVLFLRLRSRWDMVEGVAAGSQLSTAHEPLLLPTTAQPRKNLVAVLSKELALL